MNEEEVLNQEVFPEASQEVFQEVSDEELEQISLPLDEGLRLDAKVEAVIFASQKPLKTMEIFDLVQGEAGGPTTLKDVQECLSQLLEYYRDRAGGFTLRYTRGIGYQFQTVPAAAPILERQFSQRPRPISRAALETLAIIAYRQPVTRAEVEYIRGVDAGSIVKNLLERDLIACTGRKEIAGRPMVFSTTQEFLKVFQLSHVKDLPTLESFQPSHEALQKALEKLEQGEQLVDVEDYIGDEPGSIQIEAADENADPEISFPAGDLLPPGGGEVDL
jgi:segregation and condensation protein B